MFDTGKQQTDCAGDQDISITSKTSAVGSIFKKAKDATKNITGSNKILLDVYSPEEISAGGKTLEHDNIIGVLKIESNDQDLSTCAVVKGAAEIKSYMDTNKPLFVKIQTAD